MSNIDIWETNQVFTPDSLDEESIASVVRGGEISRLIADGKADSAGDSIAILDLD